MNILTLLDIVDAGHVNDYLEDKDRAQCGQVNTKLRNKLGLYYYKLNSDHDLKVLAQLHFPEFDIDKYINENYLRIKNDFVAYFCAVKGDGNNSFLSFLISQFKSEFVDYSIEQATTIKNISSKYKARWELFYGVFCIKTFDGKPFPILKSDIEQFFKERIYATFILTMGAILYQNMDKIELYLNDIHNKYVDIEGFGAFTRVVDRVVLLARMGLKNTVGSLYKEFQDKPVQIRTLPLRFNQRVEEDARQCFFLSNRFFNILQKVIGVFFQVSDVCEQEYNRIQEILKNDEEDYTGVILYLKVKQILQSGGFNSTHEQLLQTEIETSAEINIIPTL